MRLNDQLQVHLNEKGLTVASLARLSGISKNTIGDWLTGRKPKNIEQVKKIASVLNTTVDDLCFGDGLKKTTQDLDLDDILGDRWIGGVFEVRLRRVKKGDGDKE